MSFWGSCVIWRWHLWEQQLPAKISSLQDQKEAEIQGMLGRLCQLAGSPRPARVLLLQEHKLQIIPDISTVQRKL